MKRFLGVVLSLAVVVLLVFSVYAKHNGKTYKKCDKKDIPETVIKAFETAYPKAVIKRTMIVKDKDFTYYKIKSKEDKVCRKIMYNSDGSIKALKENITAEMLPATVKDAIAKAYPKYKIREVEKEVKDNVTKYEVDMKKCWFKCEEIVVDETGKISEEDEDTAPAQSVKNEATPPAATVSAAAPAVKTADMRKYKCSVCGFVYDPVVNNNVAFADLPSTWKCPKCGSTKDKFQPIE